MRASQTCINLIKSFEGFCGKAYKCPAGIPTIGWGHTGTYKGKKVTMGMTISIPDAEELLRQDLVKFETKVSKYSKYNWTQNQFDALVSFAFNVGSIDQLTANGTRTIAQIADKILQYNKAAGKELAGLTRRRKAERELFLKGGAPAQTPKHSVMVKTKGSALNCRNGANINSALIGAFKNGTELTLLDKSTPEWCKVTGRAVSGEIVTGWCSSKYLKG